MDVQSLLTYAVVVPAVVFGVSAARATRSGRTTLGLDPRHGAWRELLAGMAFAAVSVAVLIGVFWVSGHGPITPGEGGIGALAGIAGYFLVLFVIEEIVFRGFLMTGLGVVVGRWVGLLLVTAAVALPYAFAEGSGVLPVVGAVLTNLLNGLARWRTGRIWFGVGMRWVWNTAQVAIGYSVSGYVLGGTPWFRQQLIGPDWLTGGAYGPEGGVIGLALRLVMIAALVAISVRLFRSWTIAPAPDQSAAGGSKS